MTCATPLYWNGTARISELIWVEREAKYFCKRGLTRLRKTRSDLPVGQNQWIICGRDQELGGLLFPLPLWERVARCVSIATGEGFSPQMQTPHPARTLHSRCKASASFLKNGGRRPPMATFSHKGRRKKAHLTRSAAPAAARSPETAAALRSARRAPPAPDGARRRAVADAPRR